MALYTLVKFKNMAPLHLGTGKENYDFSSSDSHSDTLSAALLAIKAQYGAEDNLLPFMESVVVSSAFPYIGDHIFLPRPLGKINIEVEDEDEYIVRKRLKKLRFLEVSLWKELIAGRGLRVKGWQLKGSFLLSSDFKEEKFDLPYRSQVNQRVSVPRFGDADTEPFFFEWTYFGKDAGLYCLLDAPDVIKDEVINLFIQLGESGFGTDRNVGGGKFDVELGELVIPEVADYDSTMLLSLYIPTEDELKELSLNESRYELIHRGGYMAGSQEIDFRHLWKKSIYMFNVGSLFNTCYPLKGKVVDLKPEWNDIRMHHVYRSGKPFVVRVKR